MLLGSLGTTAAVWDRQVPALRAWFRVLRTEHPGHGGAGVPAGQGTVEALGERIVATLDRLGLTGPMWPAFPWAGWSAFGWLPITPRGSTVWCWRVRQAGSTAPKAIGNGRRRCAPRGPASSFPPPFRGGLPSPLRPAALMSRRSTLRCSPVRRPRATPIAVRPSQTPTWSPTWRVSQARALVVGGALDPVVPPDLAAATMTAIPGATLCVLAGGAHLVNVEQPDAFNDVLLRHLIGSPAERGLEERRAVLGEAHVDRALARASELTADFQELLAKWPWGEVWAQAGAGPSGTATAHDRHARGSGPRRGAGDARPPSIARRGQRGRAERGAAAHAPFTPGCRQPTPPSPSPTASWRRAKYPKA